MSNPRLATIYLSLLSDSPQSSAELADTLGASARTIRRDIDQLRAAGLPVEGEPSAGYRLSEPPGWLLFASDAELRALAAGLKSVASSGNASLAPAAKSLLAKARAQVPSRSRSKYGL